MQVNPNAVTVPIKMTETETESFWLLAHLYKLCTGNYPEHKIDIKPKGNPENRELEVSVSLDIPPMSEWL